MATRDMRYAEVTLDEVERENLEQQLQELESLQSIYSQEIAIIASESEYVVDIQPMIDQVELMLQPHMTAPSTATTPVLKPSQVRASQVSHLPAVQLYVRYHTRYPSHERPHFHISARWLNQQLVPQVREKMEELFIPGCPVVFEWATYISNDFISDYCQMQTSTMFDRERTIPLEKTEAVSCSVPNAHTSQHPCQLFVRSLSEFNDVEEHDQYEEHKLFVQSRHECGICLVCKLGEDMCRPCKGCSGPGHFCLVCVTEYCRDKIISGSVAKMTCPGCKCVGREFCWTRTVSFFRLRQETELDSVPGVTFCPRSVCAARVFSDPASDLGMCQECGFPFCKLCRQTWHGVESCPTSKIAEVVKEEEEVELPTAAAKKPVYDKNRINELKSALWLRSNDSVKPCPKCSINIQKAGGCNKMNCWKCGSYFCWLCGELISGYGHFDFSTCDMFRNEDYLPPASAKDTEELLPDDQENLENLLFSKCPRCNQSKAKIKNHNWVHCERCKFPYCHLCGEPCFGKFHFSEYGCKEFTSLKEDEAHLLTQHLS